MTCETFRGRRPVYSCQLLYSVRKSHFIAMHQASSRMKDRHAAGRPSDLHRIVFSSEMNVYNL